MKSVKDSMLLYAVTDRHWERDGNFLAQVAAALQGGVTMLQLREKNMPPGDFYREAVAAQELCRKFAVPFIINDEVELARKISADGAHIGQGDMAIERARQLLGKDKILGVSAQTVAQAIAAQEAGADYLGVGAMFPTPTKEDAVLVSPETLRNICAAVTIPVVAIGGITLDNLPALQGTGIAGVAVVSAIFAQNDIQGATAQLYAAVEKICHPKEAASI
ncbi:MAG: thiamine phosphate synthase [Selenomonadaceae bacterium]|nr:thiamine phosphate synthase [Selenomonadaceae bacterium]